MPVCNRVGLTIGLIAIGLLASFTLDWPARIVDLRGLSFSLSGRMLLGLVLMGLAWTGTDGAVRQHPQVPSEQSSFPALSCILPAALTAAAWALLARPADIQTKVLGVATTSGLLAALISAEHYVVDAAARWRVAVQFFLGLMGYLVAMLLFIVIRLSVSAQGTATIAIAAVTAALSWKLVASDEHLMQHIPDLFAVQGGQGTGKARHGWLVVMGMAVLEAAICWLFNLWAASPLVHSLVLVVLFYLGIGISRHFVLGTLTQRLGLEYLFVGLLVLLVLLSYAR